MNLQTVATIAKARGIWDYDAQPMEVVDCNLCGEGKANPKELARWEDRYGFPQKADRCKHCGLVFLNPRMTREAYARFYETAYRPLVSAFHGREINAQTIQPEQWEYGRRLARLLGPWLEETDIGVLLDVGGSTGVVAEVLSETFECAATIIDPSSSELVLAQPFARHHGTIETFEAGSGDVFQLVVMCQTADHLLDLMGALKKIKGLLSPDGLFWSDIVDFNVTREVKIDHPFNLTESTYRQFLVKAGFTLLQVNYAPDGKHIGFLARAA